MRIIQSITVPLTIVTMVWACGKGGASHSGTGSSDGSGGQAGGTGGEETSSGGTDSGGTANGAGASSGAAGAAGEGTGGSGESSTGGSGGSGGEFSTGLYDCSPASGKVPPLTLELVADGFDSPVFVSSPPEDTERLFVVEQAGIIRIIENGEIVDEPFLDLRDVVTRSGNERGLLGLAFHPNYAKNGLFYLDYSAEDGVFDLADGDTVVSEFSVSEDPNVADRDSERLLLTLNQPASNHNGGMLAFSVEGYLLIAFGDGGNAGDPRDWAQNPSNLFGTLSRIDVDSRDAGAYGIPSGNQTGSDRAPEVWDYGLRNPWRFSVDPCTGDLYIGDVGQGDYEEVDVEPRGMGSVNYGWNVLEATSCYNANSCDMSDKVPPAVEYGHGDGECVIGGYVYRGSEIPALRGTYVYGDYSSTRIWAFDYVDGVADNQRTLFETPPVGEEGITSFGQDALGEIYVLRRGGQILKLVEDD